MAEAAVGFLLENVAQVVKYQVNLIAGAEAELELLKTDLTSLKAFLHDAAAMSSKLEGFRDMESRIRDVVYDVEDAVDSCVTQAAIAKQKSSLRRRFSSKRLSLAEEVKSLREKKVIEMVKTAKTLAAAGKGSGTSNEESTPKSAKGGFGRLKFLVLEDLDIEFWVADSSCFPVLEQLHIRRCYNLTMIPTEMGDSIALQLIVVDECSQSVIESARRIKEEQEDLYNDSLQIQIHS